MRRGRRLQRGGDPLDDLRVVGGGDEPGLERGRRQIDALRQHRVEEGGEAEGFLLLGVLVVPHRLVREEHGEHVAGRGHRVRHALLGERLAHQGLDLRGDRVDLRVRRVVEQPQLGEPGGGGDRVTGEGARLVDGADGGEVRHHIGAPAEGRGREAAAHDLAEGHQVGPHPVDAEPAGLRGTESGHDLVGDVQRTVGGADLLEPGVEAVQRRHDAHVARRRLGDHTGDLAGVRGEGGPHGLQVVVRQHDRVAGLRARDPGGVRKTEGRDPGPGGGEQRVHVPVVAAGELHDLRTAGEPARQPDRGHGRLGAGRHQPYLLHGLDPGHDLLGERDLALTGRTERGAAGDSLLDCGDDLGVGMAEDHRPPRAHEVDILTAVGVGEVRTGTGHHEAGRTTHGPEGTYGRVHAAGRHEGRAVEKRLRNWGFV